MIDAATQALTPAGKAYGVIRNWMVGAKMNQCKQDADGFWICELVGDRPHRFVAWNPDGPRQFTVPGQWHSRTMTPMLGAPAV
jgi:hypothetical protein